MAESIRQQTQNRRLILEQRTPEWFAWRHHGIGSSEAPVLFGLREDYGYTVHDLWLEKTDQKKREFEYSAHAARGTAMEDQARQEYVRYTGNQVQDILFEHAKFPFVRASLDGWCEEKNLILEIKCPTAKNHYRAVAEDYIQLSYHVQIQHQFLASGGRLAHYWSYDGNRGHLIPVLPNPDLMGDLLERESLFWECVQTRTEPDRKDFVRLKTA